MYISPLFKKNLAYAQRLKPSNIFILSAKYGLVGLDDVIEPYDLTLNKMSSNEVRSWAKRVLDQLERKTDLDDDQFIFLAGDKYRKYLIPHIRHFKVPLEGLPIGKQLQRLTDLIME